MLFVNKLLEQNGMKELYHSKVTQQKFISKFVQNKAYLFDGNVFISVGFRCWKNISNASDIDQCNLNNQYTQISRSIWFVERFHHTKVFICFSKWFSCSYLIIHRFEPPGMISAGMSCYLHVTFEPKVNRAVLIFYSWTNSAFRRSMKIFGVKSNFSPKQACSLFRFVAKSRKWR